jgi:O-antigen/teichoic acid export membrane protein
MTDRRQLAALYDLGSRLAFLLALPIAGAIALQADLITKLLVGPKFGATAPALAVLAWTLPFLGIRFIACTALVAADQHRFLFIMECVAAVTYSIAAWLLIPLAGGMALAACKLASVVVFSAVAATRIRSLVGGTWWRRAIPGGALAVLAMAVVHSAFDRWGSFVALSGACVAFAFVIVATGCVTKSDLSGARQLLWPADGRIARQGSTA